MAKAESESVFNKAKRIAQVNAFRTALALGVLTLPLCSPQELYAKSSSAEPTPTAVPLASGSIVSGQTEAPKPTPIATKTPDNTQEQNTRTRNTDSSSILIQDPLYYRQWYLGATRVPYIWSHTKGENVIVAIIDSGIIQTHEDLPIPIMNINLSNSNNYSDRYGHGTNIDGIINAKHDSIGIAGIAPASKILNLKVLNDEGKGSKAAVVAAIKLAAENNARVINLSIGFKGQCTPEEQDAINFALARNAVVVASTGNDGVTAFAPANCDGVLAVGASNPDNTIPSFSGRGHIYAPASDGYSTTNEGVYGYSNTGTSVSTAITSGVAALVRSKYPSANEASVRNHLLVTSNGGVVDAERAINTPVVHVPPRPTPTPSPTAAPTECNPRPPVVLETQKANGGLETRIRAGRGQLQEPQISNLSNAQFRFERKSPTEIIAYISRIDSGPATASLTLTDACGEWKTLIGGGANAF